MTRDQLKARLEPERFKSDRWDWGWAPPWNELVDYLGFDVLLLETIGSYSGDHFVILGDGPRRGFLTIGYGSCSGCDALQASCTVDEVLGLFDGVRDNIRWEPDAQALVKYLQSKDWAAEWYGSEALGFFGRAVELLGGEPK